MWTQSQHCTLKDARKATHKWEERTCRTHLLSSCQPLLGTAPAKTKKVVEISLTRLQWGTLTPSVGWHYRRPTRWNSCPPDNMSVYYTKVVSGEEQWRGGFGPPSDSHEVTPSQNQRQEPKLPLLPNSEGSPKTCCQLEVSGEPILLAMLH